MLYVILSHSFTSFPSVGELFSIITSAPSNIFLEIFDLYVSLFTNVFAVILIELLISFNSVISAKNSNCAIWPCPKVFIVQVIKLSSFSLTSKFLSPSCQIPPIPFSIALVSVTIISFGICIVTVKSFRSLLVLFSILKLYVKLFSSTTVVLFIKDSSVFSSAFCIMLLIL